MVSEADPSVAIAMLPKQENESDCPESFLPPAIHVIITVFGDVYTRLFAEVGLANLVTMVREIPESLRRNSVVRIATTPVDRGTISRAPAFKLLTSVIDVKVEDRVVLSGYECYEAYGPMVLTLQEMVRESARDGSAMFFVGPDQIYNRGAFANHLTRFREGYRVVIGPGVRILRDESLPVLRAAIDESPDGSFALEPEAQHRLLFDQWHPINDQFLLNSATGIPWKAYVYDRPARCDLLIRFFQGPTLAAWPRRPMDNFTGYIDHDLIESCCDDWREAYVIRDGNECLALDLTDDTRRDAQRLSIFPRVDLLWELFDEISVKRMQLQHGQVTCRVHIGPDSPEEVRRWCRRFSAAVDPLILIALTIRWVGRFVPWLAPLLRGCAVAGTHTWSFLLRPIARWRQWRMERFLMSQEKTSDNAG